MAMIDMKRVSKKDAEIKEVPALAEEPVYPYGLCITLEKEELKKLGIKELPDTDETYILEAKCIVKSVSTSKGSIVGGNNEEATVRLQLTHISLEEPEEHEEQMQLYKTAQKMYDKMGGKEEKEEKED